MYVRSRDLYSALYIAMVPLQDCSRMFGELWLVEEAGRHIRIMCPRVVPIVRSAQAPAMIRRWPRKVASRAAAPGPAAAAAPLPALDDIDAAAAADGVAAADAPELGIPDGADEIAGLAGALLDAYEAPLVVPAASPGPAGSEVAQPAGVDLPPLPPPAFAPPGQPQDLPLLPRASFYDHKIVEQPFYFILFYF